MLLATIFFFFEMSHDYIYAMYTGKFQNELNLVTLAEIERASCFNLKIITLLWQKKLFDIK